MWPTQGSQSAAPSGWSERGPRARTLALAGIAALLLTAFVALWLSMRGGQPATAVYGNPGVKPGVTWTWDGASYEAVTVGGESPSSNDADMAFDRKRGVIVLWDHGCASLVMGFQGGCVAQVNRTWTWDGRAWSARSPKSLPKEVGPGAMFYATRTGQVVYVNGVGEVWAWDGSDWMPLATPGGPRVPRQDSGAAYSAFAAGYDEARGLLVFLLSTSTWTWDGSTWTEVKGGIEVAEARADAHLVYDRAHAQLVYVGSRHTWTWDGQRWEQHAQPAITTGTLAYDPNRAAVMLVQQDTSACDQKACRTTTWVWDSKAWNLAPFDRVPLLPLTRSGAFAPPMASDEARGVVVFFASAS